MLLNYELFFVSLPSNFFTHIHDYDEDYSRDLLELLPHNLKQKGVL